MYYMRLLKMERVTYQIQSRRYVLKSGGAEIIRLPFSLSVLFFEP